MKEYQSRYIAFARSKGLTPQEAEKNFSTLDFIIWMNEQWRCLGEKLGFKRDKALFIKSIWMSI